MSSASSLGSSLGHTLTPGGSPASTSEEREFLNGFDELGELGQGAQGRVLLVRNKRTREKLVLKVIRQDRQPDGARLQEEVLLNFKRLLGRR